VSKWLKLTFFGGGTFPLDQIFFFCPMSMSILNVIPLIWCYHLQVTSKDKQINMLWLVWMNLADTCHMFCKIVVDELLFWTLHTLLLLSEVFLPGCLYAWLHFHYHFCFSPSRYWVALCLTTPQDVGIWELVFLSSPSHPIVFMMV